MGRQSKRATFAHRQRLQRRIARVHRSNRGAQGYVGAVLSLSVTTHDGRTVKLLTRPGQVGAVFLSAPASGRCKGCDVPNGCPEFCRCAADVKEAERG